MSHQKRVTMEKTDDGGFIIRATQETKRGFNEHTEVADKFEAAMKKMKKHFKEGKKI